MVSRVGLEPTTPSLRGSCSNQLSYRPKYGLCLTIVMQMYLWRLGSYSENDFTRQHVPQTELSYRPKYGLCLTIVMQMYLWRLGSCSENDFTRQHVPRTELSYRPKYGLCLTILLYHKTASFTILILKVRFIL